MSCDIAPELRPWADAICYGELRIDCLVVEYLVESSNEVDIIIRCAIIYILRSKFFFVITHHRTTTCYQPLHIYVWSIGEKSCYILFANTIVLVENASCHPRFLIKFIGCSTFYRQILQDILLNRRFFLNIFLHNREILFIFAPCLHFNTAQIYEKVLNDVL